MKAIALVAVLNAASLFPLSLCAEDDPLDELAALAGRYVEAYNEKRLDDLVAVYTPEAELTDLQGHPASGREAIREVLAASFEAAPDRKLSLEVASVRQIAAGVVVEEGMARFSDGGESGEIAAAYTAILVKAGDEGWRIASSRQSVVAPPPADPLAALHPLEGEWVLQSEGLSMELSISPAPGGRYLVGTAVTATPADGEMRTDLRIGFDASTNRIRWWTFDELGGFAEGIWQPVGERSWTVRTHGVTADGEPSNAVQELEIEEGDTIVWRSSHRFLANAALPDVELRLARRPPPPAPLPESSAGDARPNPKP